MNWVDKLKIALLENNLSKAFALVESCPFVEGDGTDLETLQTAQELIFQTLERLKEAQGALGVQMRQLRAAQRFLDIS
ncbi:hypothetical protein ACFOPX_00100 [Helicobacter baculiformis]|uniref:Uncharacterized protein n=1 Tax=Helicobacter baculiformis TaxID=427351 RepID=A0ABV7ZFA3_9HELI|nr:hypothetical protein [Helicobacter baculiformis]